MRPTRTLPRFLLAFAFAALAPIAGCGGSGVSEGQMSPAAKSANDAGIKAVEDFMKTKQQKKKKSGGKAAGDGGAPIPGGASPRP
ncbi:MAG: hypothetical protein U0800_22430 [Isosphaeraceae bacterium]